MSYITEITDLFLARNSGVKILKPEDYRLIAEWEKQGIPLFIILDSVNNSFDLFPQNKIRPRIESIAFFQEDIKKRFVDWLQKQSVVS